MFGVGRDDAVGRPIGAVVPVPGGESAWTTLIAAGQPAQREWETHRPGQRPLTCAWTIQPLSAGGAVCYGQEVVAPAEEATQQKARRQFGRVGRVTRRVRARSREGRDAVRGGSHGG